MNATAAENILSIDRYIYSLRVKILRTIISLSFFLHFIIISNKYNMEWKKCDYM